MPRLPLVSSICLALAAFAAPPAGAQDNTAICKDEASAPEAAIAACSKIISASKAKTNDLASTYYNRAIAYRKGIKSREQVDPPIPIEYRQRLLNAIQRGERVYPAIEAAGLS